MQFMFLSDGVKPQIPRVKQIHMQNGNKIINIIRFSLLYDIVVWFCTFMRLCLIPSTICSICLRNCSLLPDEAIALKTQIHFTLNSAFRKDITKINHLRLSEALAVILGHFYMDSGVLFETHCWKWSCMEFSRLTCEGKDSVSISPHILLNTTKWIPNSTDKADTSFSR